MNFERQRNKLERIKKNNEYINRIKELCKIKKDNQDAICQMISFMQREDIKNFRVIKSGDDKYMERSLRGLRKRKDPRHRFEHGLRLSSKRWILYNTIEK